MKKIAITILFISLLAFGNINNIYAAPIEPIDFYDMDEICRNYPDSPRCYGNNDSWNRDEILLFLVIIGAGIVFYYASKK